MQTRLIYWVTAEGTIVRAESHHAPASFMLGSPSEHPFNAADYLGRNLFTFIQGGEIRHVYSVFHDRVLRSGREISFRYRCDAPAVRREMSMLVSPDAGLIRYESVLLKETPRLVPLPVNSPGAPDLVSLCGMCNRYRFPANIGEWREIDEILLEPSLPDRFDFSHGICGRCYEYCLEESAGF